MAGVVDNKPYLQMDTPSQSLMRSFTLFDEASLLQTVNKFSICKSIGIMNIPTGVLMDAIHVRPDIFVRICNISLTPAIFPEHCKLARIKIIPKKGDERFLDNFHHREDLRIDGEGGPDGSKSAFFN